MPVVEVIHDGPFLEENQIFQVKIIEDSGTVRYKNMQLLRDEVGELRGFDLDEQKFVG